MSDDADVSASVNKLSLTSNKEPTQTTKPASKKKAKKVVADSWEDEDVSDSEPEAESDKADELTPSATPAPPPLTPMSPVGGSAWTPPEDAPGPRAGGESAKRPEKTDAVARRMIAAGLGLKAPKQTEEQRAYQKSIREQEKKRREQEREQEKKRQEEAEQAKAAIWDD